MLPQAKATRCTLTMGRIVSHVGDRQRAGSMQPLASAGVATSLLWLLWLGRGGLDVPHGDARGLLAEGSLAA